MGAEKTELEAKAQRQSDYKPGQIRAKGNYRAIRPIGGKYQVAGSVTPGDLVSVNYNVIEERDGLSYVAIKVLEKTGEYSDQMYWIQEYKVAPMSTMPKPMKVADPSSKLKDFIDGGMDAFGLVGKTSGSFDEITMGTKGTFSTEVVGGKLEGVADSQKSDTLKDFEHHATGFDAFSGSVGMATGIFGFAQGLHRFAKGSGLDRLEAALDMLVTGTSTVSGFTKMVSKGIEHKEGTASDGWAMAANVTSTLTSAASAVKDTAMTIIGLVKLTRDRKSSTTKGQQAAKIGVMLLEAVKSGLNLAKSFFIVLDRSIPLSMATSIPALGIVINAASLVISFATAYLASKQKSIMERGELADRTVLVGEFGEDHLDRMLVEDKRGVFGTRRTYRRFHPLLLARLEAHDWSSGNYTARLTSSKTLEITEAQYRMIKRYEFSSKMYEINQKRQVKGNLGAASSLVSLAADVANVTGVGAVVGGAIKAALLSGELLYGGGKFIQQIHRNRAAKSTRQAIQSNLTSSDSLKTFSKGGLSTDKSSSTKNKQYRKHARFVCEMVAHLPDATAMAAADTVPKREDIVAKYDSAEAYIKSTGVDVGLLYAENGQPEQQYKRLVSAISSR